MKRKKYTYEHVVTSRVRKKECLPWLCSWCRDPHAASGQWSEGRTKHERLRTWEEERLLHLFNRRLITWIIVCSWLSASKKRERYVQVCYPVHFQQHAWFPLRISKAGVGEAGAEAQVASLETTHLLLPFLTIVLQKIVSSGAVLVLLLVCIVVF